jgi:hypothetical protein
MMFIIYVVIRIGTVLFKDDPNRVERPTAVQ